MNGMTQALQVQMQVQAQKENRTGTAKR